MVIFVSDEEFSSSQFVTLKGKGHNIKYLPYAFTEHGVVMLESLLRGDIAVIIPMKDICFARKIPEFSGNLHITCINESALKSGDYLQQNLHLKVFR